MMAKIKWEVATPPVGKFRSFARRDWPTGTTECGMFFAVRCADEYVPCFVKTGDHSPLHLAFRDGNSHMRVFAREFSTLAAVKEFAKGLDLDALRRKIDA